MIFVVKNLYDFLYVKESLLSLIISLDWTSETYFLYQPGLKPLSLPVVIKKTICKDLTVEINSVPPVFSMICVVFIGGSSIRVLSEI
jgi:ABC-type spermidine/putrescine transport system permease subunit II